MILLKLVEIMKAKNLTAEQLAGKSYVSFSSVINAMKGRSITANTAAHIAKGLRVKIEELQ